MALDAFVRCTCIREGKAKPHPFPDRLTFDESRRADAYRRSYRRRMGSARSMACRFLRARGIYPLVFSGQHYARWGICAASCATCRENQGHGFLFCWKKFSTTARTPVIGFPSRIAGPVERSRYRTALQRHSGRLRERILHQHEATVRGQHRDRKPDYVLRSPG